jgi:nucleotide-binding universal stress UspA family protein
MEAQTFVVVVGYDFSELAEEAARVARNIAAAAARSELHVVHVTPPPAVMSELGPAFPVEKSLNDAREEVKKLLERLKVPDNVSVTPHVTVGTPETVLPAVAEEVEANLLVVGTHGRKGLQRMLLGSVAESVTRRAPCSVLTVRPHKPTARESIEPPCPDCTVAQKAANDAKALCDHHAKHHPRAHTHYESPKSFGMGSLTFRFPGD